jgi:hypothetical protein
MWGENGIFRGKSFEKLFPQEIPRKFCGKSLSAEKNVRKIDPRLGEISSNWAIVYFGQIY